MINIDQNQRPSCEDLLKHPKICFVVRALRLREMEANVKRKEEEVKAKSQLLKDREAKLGLAASGGSDNYEADRKRSQKLLK